MCVSRVHRHGRCHARAVLAEEPAVLLELITRVAEHLEMPEVAWNILGVVNIAARGVMGDCPCCNKRKEGVSNAGLTASGAVVSAGGARLVIMVHPSDVQIQRVGMECISALSMTYGGQIAPLLDAGIVPLVLSCSRRLAASDEWAKHFGNALEEFTIAISNLSRRVDDTATAKAADAGGVDVVLSCLRTAHR